MKGGWKKKEIFLSEREKIKKKLWELKIQNTAEEVLNCNSQGFKCWDAFSSRETKDKSVNETEGEVLWICRESKLTAWLAYWRRGGEWMEDLSDKIYRCLFNLRNERGCRWGKMLSSQMVKNYGKICPTDIKFLWCI